MRKYSKAEIELARRICRAEYHRGIEFAVKAPAPTLREMFDRIASQPLQLSYGPTPPWWVQATAYDDYDLVWVSGMGWMPTMWWNDALKAFGPNSE